MHFTLENVDYRLGFSYFVVPKARSKTIHRGDVVVTLAEVWNKYTAEAFLFKKVDGPGAKDVAKDPPRAFHWEVVAAAKAACSKADKFSKVRGREMALARLCLQKTHQHHAPKLPKELAGATMQAYQDRYVIAEKVVQQ